MLNKILRDAAHLFFGVHLWIWDRVEIEAFMTSQKSLTNALNLLPVF